MVGMSRLGGAMIAALAVAMLTVVYVLWPTGNPNAPAFLATAPPAARPGQSLDLRLSTELSPPGVLRGELPGRAAPAPLPTLPLLLGSALLLCGAAGFWAGDRLRRRRALGLVQQPSETAVGHPDPAATSRSPEAAASEPDDAGRQDALARLAGELEAKQSEIRRLQQEIADWQDAWRVAKPRLSSQQASIEQLEMELGAARSTVTGLRRYISELQQQRSVPADPRFNEDVDAWIAKFMRPARPG